MKFRVSKDNIILMCFKNDFITNWKPDKFPEYLELEGEPLSSGGSVSAERCDAVGRQFGIHTSTCPTQTLSNHVDDGGSVTGNCCSLCFGWQRYPNRTICILPDCPCHQKEHPKKPNVEFRITGISRADGSILYETVPKKIEMTNGKSATDVQLNQIAEVVNYLLKKSS